MKLKHILLLFAFLFFGNNIYACSCDHHDPRFCRAVNERRHVVLAVVTDTLDRWSMEVEILDTIKGAMSLDTISILGQDGLNCGAVVKGFNINDTLIFALHFGQAQNAQNGDIHDAYLHGCGLHFLSYQAGRVVGSISDSIQSQSYADFKNNIYDCVALPPISSVKNLASDIGLSIFPNPANNEIFVEIQLETFDKTKFEVINSIGKTVMKNIELGKGKNRIGIEKLNAPGVYFLRARTPKGIIVRKFLKL